MQFRNLLMNIYSTDNHLYKNFRSENFFLFLERPINRGELINHYINKQENEKYICINNKNMCYIYAGFYWRELD